MTLQYNVPWHSDSLSFSICLNSQIRIYQGFAIESMRQLRQRTIQAKQVTAKVQEPRSAAIRALLGWLQTFGLR